MIPPIKDIFHKTQYDPTQSDTAINELRLLVARYTLVSPSASPPCDLAPYFERLSLISSSPDIESQIAIRSSIFQLLPKLCEKFTPAQFQTFRMELAKVHVDPYVSQAFLDKLQILEDASLYGNKTANLITLDRLFPGQVPQFIGISHAEINAHLEQDEKLNEYWQEFRQIQSGTAITPLARKLLQQIAERICELFSVDVGLNIGEFLARSTSVMVRSTGRNEDSDKMMLAGANISVAGVAPEPTAICRAIAQVISSYFGASLDQQVQAGCDITSSYFVPVLLQQMVGEDREGAPITVSGVMFSEEPQGQTPGTVIISASYGREAGVTDQVPCDRILLTRTGECYKSVVFKEQRIGPDGLLIQNPPLIRERCCLPDKIITQLNEIARKLQKFYARPVDIEFAVINSKIKLLQVRVITGKEQDHASYLTVDDGIKGEMLSAGSAIVCHIATVDDAIFAPTVSHALEIYLHGNKKIKAVFVQNSGENLSHFISTFLSHAIPVIALPSAMQLKSQLPFSLCSQQGLVQLGPQVDSQEGWHSHPASSAISLIQPKYRREPDFEDFFQPTDEFTNITLMDLAEDLKNPSPEVVQNAVKVLLHRIYSLFTYTLQDSSQGLQQRIKILFAQIFEAGYAAYLHAKKDRQMEQLLAAKMVEGRLKSAPGSHKLVDGEGLDQLLARARLENAAYAEIGPIAHDEQVLELYKISRLMLDSTPWKALLQQQEHHPTLIKMVHWLAKRNLLDLYMNGVFPDLAKAAPNSSKLISSMLLGIAKDKEVLEWCDTQMHNLDSLELSVMNFGKLDETEYQKLLELFKNKLITLLINEFSKERYTKAERLGKMLITQIYCRLTQVYDAALKALVDSPQFQKEDALLQRTRFTELFSPFFELQYLLVQLLTETSLSSLVKNVNTTTPISVDQYLNEFRKKYESIKASKRLLTASPGFSVEQSVLGSDSMFLFKMRTIVDCWTLSHQNLIMLCAMQSKEQNQFSDILSIGKGLEDGFFTIANQLSQLPIMDREGKKTINLVHMQLQYPWLNLRFNIPMHHHSAILDLRFNRENKTVQLHFRGYGHHGNLRWRRSMLLAHAAKNAVQNLKFVKGQGPKVDETPDVHTFTWVFNLPTAIDEQAKLFATLTLALKQIIWCTGTTHLDEKRFKSPVSGRDFSTLSDFEMIKDLHEQAGSPFILQQYLKKVNTQFLDYYFSNVWITVSDTTFDSTLAYFMDDTCPHAVETLVSWIARHLSYANKKNIILHKKLLIHTVKLKNLFEKAFSTSPHEKTKDDLFLTILPSFYIPDDSWRERAVDYLIKNTVLDHNELTHIQVLCFYLCQFLPRERQRIYRHLNNSNKEFLEKVVLLLPSCPIRTELIEFLLDNQRMSRLLQNICFAIDRNRFEIKPDPTNFDCFVLSKEEHGVVCDDILNNLPLLIQRGRISQFMPFIQFAIQSSSYKPILDVIYPHLNKRVIDEWRKQDRRNENDFFAIILPFLCERSPEWLIIYRQDLLNLAKKNSIYEFCLPTSVCCVLADVLESILVSDRQNIYQELSVDPNKKGTSLVELFLYSKNLIFQQEIRDFLVKNERWDLLMQGAWKPFNQISRDRPVEFAKGKALLRELFDAATLENYLKKIPVSDPQMVIEILSLPATRHIGMELLLHDDDLLLDVLTYWAGDYKILSPEPIFEVLDCVRSSADETKIQKVVEYITITNIEYIQSCCYDEGQKQSLAFWEALLSK